MWHIIENWVIGPFDLCVISGAQPVLISCSFVLFFFFIFVFFYCVLKAGETSDNCHSVTGVLKHFIYEDIFFIFVLNMQDDVIFSNSEDQQDPSGLPV